MSKKNQKKPNIYYREDIEECLNLQLYFSCKEIGFIMIFKAHYLFKNGKIPVDKLIEICEIPDVGSDIEEFTQLVNKICKVKNGLFKNKSFDHTIKYHMSDGTGILPGDRHWNWKGGITPKTQKIRGSQKTKDWRVKVFKRDDFTCLKCLKRGGALHAHHIKSFAKYPKLRFTVSNGATLCKPCHNRIHSKDSFKIKIGGSDE